jgi:hypothetical protein
MNKEHVISDEATSEIHLALSKNENWLAYNNIPYFLEREDLYFFKNQDEANEFATNNISEYDSFQVIHFESLADVFRQIPYGENLSLQNRIDPDANPLYNKDGNAFTDAWIDHIEEQQKISNNLNNKVMNEENLDYLQKKILYTGFGDKLNAELKENMQQLKPDFSLEHKATIGKEEINAKLYFRKSDSSDYYFFNKYDMSLKSPDAHAERSQTFYMDKGHGTITAKEAYNLLAGRAIHKEMTNKEGQTYYAWQQMNFELKDKHGNHLYNQYHQNYGFNLSEVLNKHHIKEMENQSSREMLIKSLEKGNLQSVTITVDGKNAKSFIEANPQSRSVNIYDSEMKLQHNQSQKQVNGQSVGKDLKQEEKQEKKEEQKQDLKQDKKKEEQKMSSDDDLEKKKGKSKSRSH